MTHNVSIIWCLLNHQHFACTFLQRCVEAGAGHILGGSQESVCANLSPASPPSEYLTCLRFVHRCLNFAHRYTVVLIGKSLSPDTTLLTGIHNSKVKLNFLYIFLYFFIRGSFVTYLFIASGFLYLLKV